MKRAWYWHKNKQVDQWNRIKDLDINSHTYEHLIFFIKKPKLDSGKRKASSTNGADISGCQHVEEHK